MRARYAGALLAAMLIAAIAVGQTSSRARLSTAGGSGTVSTATAPLVITGSDIAMPPASASQSGYLNNVAGYLIVDAGFRVNTAGGEGIEVTGGTGNNNLIKNGNAALTGMIQTDTGTSLTLYSNSFPALKIGVGSSGVTTPYTYRSTIASGSVAQGQLTGSLACLGTSDVGCLSYETSNASVNSTVAIASPTEFTSFSVAPNALLAATALGGHIIGPKAFTVTGISPFVATQAVTTAASLVFTITDGTNTCTGTFTCDGTGIASLQGTGPKRVATANGAGTGCVYAASAALTLSVSTQGCGTAPIVNNIDVVGKWQ